MKKFLLVFLTVFALNSPALYAQCGSLPTINFNQNTFINCPNSGGVDIQATPNGTVGNVYLQWTPGGAADTTVNYHVNPTAPETWYYLELTDDCFTVVDSVKVEYSPVALSSIAVTNAINCPSQTSFLGEIAVTPDDPLWVYQLLGGGISPLQTNGTFPNLDGGINYILTVMNSDGCSLDTIVPVGLGQNLPSANFVLDSLMDPSCFGSMDGSAYIENITGGLTAPYDVTWTNTNGIYFSETVTTGGNSDIDNLPSGLWVVSVQDQDGCAWSLDFTISEPDELQLNVLFNNPTCYQFSDGSILVNVSGGNGGNTYEIVDSSSNILNPGNTNTANSLAEGWYYMSVIDMAGCTTSDSIFIDDPGELTLDYTVGVLLCSYDSTWIKVDTVFNATGDYNQISYYWTPNPSGNQGIGADSVYNITNGSYILTVNDANGCSETFDLDAIAPPALQFSQLSSNPCTNGSDGSVSAAASGGTGSYTYTWTNLSDQTTTNNTTWGGLGPANYQITVTDGNGCTLIDTVAVGCLGFEENDLTSSVSLFPNPSSGGAVNVLFDTEMTNISFTVFDTQGRAVYQSKELNGYLFELDFQELEGGIYFLKISQESKYGRIRFVIE